MLETYLNTKPLYYDTIDYTRMPRVYASIDKELNLPKIIHLVGTNGKGTTGRFLASALYSLGLKVGHYTSPHIRNFNERIWKNGADASREVLNQAHAKLLSLLSQADADALSYFEYTTLLSMLVYEDVEYLVLEAGLGGEHDATAVFPNILTLVTPIDKDHEAFLGENIEDIARTKLRAIQKSAIFAHQTHPQVEKIASELALEKGVKIYKHHSFLEDKDRVNIEQIAQENNLVEYLKENLQVAIATLKYLKIPYEVKNFAQSRLYGRVTQYKKNIILDVGHNTLAAKALYKTLEGNKYTLIYNSYRDKNYREILEILQPIVEEVELIEINDARVEKREVMEECLQSLSIKYTLFTQVHKEKSYLVFGSFSVVEAFLKAQDE